VKAPSFTYAAPASLDEAIDVLAADGEARPLAGGQSLVPLLAMRLAQPTALVDLAGVAGLDAVAAENGGLRIGAMATQRALERSPTVAERLPLLAEAVSWIAHAAIRNRGTIGGSIAHADPAAELPAVALVHEASLRVRGPQGERTLGASEFFAGPFTTALGQGEILTSIAMPSFSGGWSFQEVARRSGDFALALVAVLLAREGDICRDVRIAVAGVGAVAARLPAVEGVVAGAALEEDVLAAAERATQEGVTPSSDVHGSAEYRRELAGTLVRRALAEAWRRAA
jgi:carbon-monoxide dehydrogenase medium subunit